MRQLLTPLLLMLLVATPLAARATAQEPDVILVEGKAFALNTNPLDKHLARTGWTPPEDAAIWSSNWRGYLAQWAIEDGQLVLVDATVTVAAGRGEQEETRSIREELFPATPRVVATWFSGALLIPDGKLTEYVHLGYGSSYDHYQLFRITQGQVTEHLSLTGEQFADYRDRKFQEYAKTKEYREALDELEKDGTRLSDDQRVDFMKNFYAERYLSR